VSPSSTIVSLRSRLTLTIHTLIPHSDTAMKYEYLYNTRICTCYRVRGFSTSRENFQRKNEMETHSKNILHDYRIIASRSMRFGTSRWCGNRSRNVGITSTIKNFVSLTTSKNITLENAGWDGTVHLFRTPPSEDFNFCVQLNTFLGFCEDYKRIVINARHELILIRTRNDNNCVVARIDGT